MRLYFIDGPIEGCDMPWNRPLAACEPIVIPCGSELQPYMATGKTMNGMIVMATCTFNEVSIWVAQEAQRTAVHEALKIEASRCRRRYMVELAWFIFAVLGIIFLGWASVAHPDALGFWGYTALMVIYAGMIGYQGLAVTTALERWRLNLEADLHVLAIGQSRNMSQVDHHTQQCLAAMNKLSK